MMERTQGCPSNKGHPGNSRQARGMGAEGLPPACHHSTRQIPASQTGAGSRRETSWMLLLLPAHSSTAMLAPRDLLGH